MIPTAEDFKSSQMVHRHGDLFNPPGLTNFLGCVQTGVDPLAIRSLVFPPLSGSDRYTAQLFIDDRFFAATGTPIKFVWYPDRIVREAEYDGLRLTSVTVLPVGRTAAMVLFDIENLSERGRSLKVRIGLSSGVCKSASPWSTAVPPAELDHEIAIDPATRAVSFTARQSGAVSVQGAYPVPDGADPRGLEFDLRLEPKSRRQISFINALGETLDSALATFSALVRRVPDEIERTKKEWDEEIRSIFTPGNTRFSGFLPELETSDQDLLRLYQMGALGVVYFKRDSPHSVIGRAYDTLMPRFWATRTYLWDYSLSSLVHALLDPQVMRKYLELWMRMDIHKHLGTEWLTGGPTGPWYSVNDFAMSKMAHDYLRWTGDHAFMHVKIQQADGPPATVLEHLESYAVNWKNFKTPQGLADYGGINNLLECVSTYVHEVASLNAANVYNMRFVAEVFDLLGDTARAEQLLREARELAAEVQKLYVGGKGYWNARYPDGRSVPVRHCYDFFTVINTMADELTPVQKREMFDFFLRELRTPTWMHALSAGDPDAMSSDRPDHQWNGAYTAWPAQSLTALFGIGEVDAAFAWMSGLAKSANQGPFGQAHFVESVAEPEDGGARKAPSDFPWINDWACSSNGAWTSVVIESIFGVRATMSKGITAEPRFGPLDKDSRLRNLSYQGELYDVDVSGIHRRR